MFIHNLKHFLCKFWIWKFSIICQKLVKALSLALSALSPSSRFCLTSDCNKSWLHLISCCLGFLAKAIRNTRLIICLDSSLSEPLNNFSAKKQALPSDLYIVYHSIIPENREFLTIQGFLPWISPEMN